MKNKSKNIIVGIMAGLLVLMICIIIIITFVFRRYYINNPPITKRVKTETIKPGLVAHWPFDEVENNITFDRSQNKNHGILNSRFGLNLIFGLPSKVKGKIGTALKFDGKQWVSCGNKKHYNSNIFTIATWVWREHNNSSVPTIMAKSSWPSYDGWWLCTKPGTKYIDMGIAWGDTYTHVESGYELPIKEWHHISVTMNNLTHEIQFFVDGVPFGLKHQNVHEWLINWNHEMFIGDYDGSGRWPWFGKLDDVRYYNKILTPEEIFSIYSEE